MRRRDDDWILLYFLFPDDYERVTYNSDNFSTSDGNILSNVIAILVIIAIVLLFFG